MRTKTANSILISILVLFLSCKNIAQIEPPTKEEIAIGMDNALGEVNKQEAELHIINDLDRGKVKAEKEGKPILLIFTGYGVINSRKLESEVIFKNERILNLLKNKFINVWLYVDDNSENGKKWNELQTLEFKGNYQPQIFILDSKGNILDGGIGYKESKQELLQLLEKYK